ncbi:MAG: hypothetical protein KJO21_08710 [Verrucomicrobiae bacterium]|nr:hypothetical protein [Verrucomicrobiae bacterium]NNJ42418.1 hypothetical protein [Akkermansiaceae bacterium]
MRKLGTYFLILLLITAYGRCMADQLGMLHTTAASCCQVSYDDRDHCKRTSDADHQHPETPGHPNNEEQPSPCQLCLILSNDSMLLEDGVKIPTPSLLDTTPLFTFQTTWQELLGTHLDHFPPPPLASSQPESAIEQHSQLGRIATKTTPVRGPSMA